LQAARQLDGLLEAVEGERHFLAVARRELALYVATEAGAFRVGGLGGREPPAS
jgi:hypothetical protein